MSVISGKQLLGSLKKAKKLGVVETTFDLDGCPVTLRNLLPAEYEAILAECQDFVDVAYMNAFQKAHISRSIQQLDEIDFRGVDFVEVQEPDPKKPGQERTIKLELHAWLRKNVVDTWSKEAIHSAFRKFAEVVTEAETKAKEGITFSTADETGEEAFRRTLAEAKNLQEEVPPALVLQILHEHGYDFYTREENAAALSKLDKVTEELAGEEEEEEPIIPEPSPKPEPPSGSAAPAVAVPQVAQQPPTARVPLNQLPAASPAFASRAEIALAKEMDVNPNFDLELAAARAATQTKQGVVPLPVPDEIPVLEKSTVDVAKIQQSIDRPPTIGFNPKYRPSR